jgi:hypothetical protein
MPLADPHTFAQALNDACDRVVIDHYLLGDGSKHGARTKRTNFLQLLDQAGFGEWAKIDKLWEVRDLLAGVLGAERVLVSAEGFNAVGSQRTPPRHITLEDRKSLPIALDVPHLELPCADRETSDPRGGDVAILSLNQNNEAPQNVYESLREHQQTVSEKLRLLHTYVPLIVERFFGGTLPLPALSCEKERITRLGSYRHADGLALSHRININAKHIDRPLPELLATLTHELGHQHEHLFGKPGKPPYHSTLFRRKMSAIGLPCDQYGRSVGMQDPFVSFLRELGVEDVAAFMGATEALARQPGKSKLQKLDLPEFPW